MLVTIMRASDPDLARSQLSSFSRQLPAVYLILIINTLSLTATYMRMAPLSLTVVAPGVLCGGCLLRLLLWLRRSAAEVSADRAIRQVVATMWHAIILGISFTAWSLSLWPYGDDLAHAHVAFYMSITVIACIFCLMPLPRAALALTVVVVVPFTAFFCTTGNMVFTAIAVNFLLVSCGMIMILLKTYGDFEALVTSQQELLVRQAETQRLNDDNFRLANHDSLTGLPNRRHFLARLHGALTQAAENGEAFAVALIDLDGFKGVNDAHGHGAGDRLLQEVSTRLSEIVSPRLTFARLGGDEFGVIYVGNPDDSDVLALGRRLCALLKGPYLVSDIQAEASGTVGLVTFPEGGRTAMQLFERADYALYHAKKMRRGEAVMFSTEHETMIRHSSRMEQALRHADYENEMYLEFQPIIDALTREVVCFEALARWHSPVLGLVRPDVFISMAERLRLMGPLTQALLKQAMAAAALWPADVRISFNLSTQDLTTPATVAGVCKILVDSGIQPERIDLEVTETAGLRDYKVAESTLASLRDLGVRISLDDFGTGFSSLSHVHRLRLDKIKIDRSFVTDINSNQTSRDIVTTITDLCRNRNLECVVEGVETEEQLRVLRSLGCRFMQGYLFGRPMSLMATHEFIALHALNATPRLLAG